MSGKFECKVGKDGKHRFNLKAGNGQVILTSEGYNDRSGCNNGIESVRKHGVQHDTFEKKTASNGQFYFVLKAGNGQVIGRSEQYSSEAACDNGIDSVKRHAGDAAVTEADD